jgi:hypothetical protein
MSRLAWAQEAPGSNPGAPTIQSVKYLDVITVSAIRFLVRRPSALVAI